jgi:tripartite-type tricarboxylate transporter receptor subunit TctC
MKTSFGNMLHAAILALCMTVVTGTAQAQYPAKPIRLIVPFAAGGASDTAARSLGQVLTKSLGQPLVIENRPGAGGAIAAQAVLTAPADGYTLLWGAASMVAIPLLQKSAPFQSFAEFTPISLAGRLTYCVYVHPGVPAKSIGEFIAYARSQPGKLSYATGSLGEYMVTAQLIKSAGLDMVQVPYKGGAQAMPDLIAGRVQLNIGPFAGGFPHVKAGKLRMLATLLPQRSPETADIPTLTEAGVQNVSSPTWQAIFAPPKTPQAIVDRLAGEVMLALRDAELRTQFERQAVRGESSTPGVLAALVAEDTETWRRFIRENNIPQE